MVHRAGDNVPTWHARAKTRDAPDAGGVESCFILERNVFGLPTEHPSGGNLYSAYNFKGLPVFSDGILADKEK